DCIKTSLESNIKTCPLCRRNLNLEEFINEPVEEEINVQQPIFNENRNVQNN
ncbi:hypothetical protein Mgra_00001020, partial [Meloidogyne graminicola]